MVEPGVDEVAPEPVRERLDAALAAPAGDDLIDALAVIRPRPLATGAAAKATGGLHQVIIRALTDHGGHGPREDRVKPAAVTSFSSVPPPRVPMGPDRGDAGRTCHLAVTR
jgi:hypothetical protein